MGRPVYLFEQSGIFQVHKHKAGPPDPVDGGVLVIGADRPILDADAVIGAGESGLADEAFGNGDVVQLEYVIKINCSQFESQPVAQQDDDNMAEHAGSE